MDRLDAVLLQKRGGVRLTVGIRHLNLLVVPVVVEALSVTIIVFFSSPNTFLKAGVRRVSSQSIHILSVMESW